MTFATEILRSQSAELGINPQGGYVSSWQLKNKEGKLVDILYQGKTKKRTGIPVLLPYFGTAEGKRQHGFGRDSAWTVEKHGNTITMSLDWKTISIDAKKEFPYPCLFTIELELADDGSFTYLIKVKNTGGMPMPISPGLHPYWAIDHEQKNQIKIEGIPAFDAKSAEWNTTPPNTPYPYLGKTIVRFLDKSITIEDVTQPTPVIKYLVVWSQTPDKDDFNFVCVEPVCGENEALYKDPSLVAAGQEWQMKIKFSAEVLA